MPMSRTEGPDLPEFMTWEELEQLPEDIAQQVELWNGRVVWVRPLHPANYLVAGEWTPADEHGVRIEFPFPITIGWPELEY